eukprot:6059508-Pyramimonas_sp.AAC.1
MWCAGPHDANLARVHRLVHDDAECPWHMTLEIHSDPWRRVTHQYRVLAPGFIDRWHRHRRAKPAGDIAGAERGRGGETSQTVN